MHSLTEPDVLERLRQTEAILGPCVVISLTETMLKKSIIDAVEPLRNLLKSTGAHDYERQEQGPEYKVRLQARILTERQVIPTTTSLYRPVTKQGDPRFWISGLGRHTGAGTQLALTVGANGELLVVVLTVIDWASSQRFLERGFGGFVRARGSATTNPHLEELVARLRRLASGPALRALVEADTGVGRTLEHALDIHMNSSKEPDYKGIELKFARQRPVARRNRSTLFAQVPDWDISPCTSSAAILDRFGYQRDGVLKLYTEVGGRANSLGLYLVHDAVHGVIEERSRQADVPVVARWRMAKLDKRLSEKHAETAWVECESIRIHGAEHFRPIRVLYTSAPRLDVFPLLVAAGLITMDHLIKRTGTRVTEKGPLWKLEPDGHSSLFAGAREIALL
jgi:hypothetical protein